jgi:hypothetical protein
MKILGGSWSQIGQDIDGEALLMMQSGNFSVTYQSDGNI